MASSNSKDLLIVLGLGAAAAVGFAVLWPRIAKALPQPQPSQRLRFIGDLAQDGDIVLVDITRAPAPGYIPIAQQVDATVQSPVLRPLIRTVAMRVDARYSPPTRDILAGEVIGTPDVQFPQTEAPMIFGPAFVTRESVERIERNGRPVLLP